MARIALIVGVSDYDVGVGSLPACKNDVDAFNQMVELDGRFDEILVISEGVYGQKTKKNISDFIDSYRGKEVEEFLFYFSGHGDYFDGDFYYLLQDFDLKKRRQTSLVNSEIDNMVRSLNPGLFVKIVDACHSGMTYIKSNENIDLYFKSTQNLFNKIYFLFSSQATQSSYQNDKISDFTDSILKSVVESEAGSVRYSDVMSYVADHFEATGHQTPLFVTQADHTEVFVSLGDNEKVRLRGIVQPAVESSTAIAVEIPMVLAKILSDKSKSYCGEEDANRFLESLTSILEKEIDLKDLDEVYNYSVSEGDKEAPSPASIGKWLDQNDDDVNYFAKKRMTTERYMRPKIKGALANFAQLSSLYGADPTEYVEDTRTVIGGYEKTWKGPYDHLILRFDQKLPIVSPEACYIVPIVSRTLVRFFWSFSHFEYTDWESTRRTSALQWVTESFYMKDESALKKVIGRITTDFLKFVREPLEQKWLSKKQPLDNDD